MRYYCAFFTLCLSSSFFKEISRVVTFSCIVQFSRCCSAFCFLAVQLFYYITSSTVCQVLFSSFFKKLFQHSRFKMSVIRQPIYYITSFRVCQVVFKKVFYLIFSEVIFISSRKSFQLSPLIISSMRFLAFCCRSLTTVIIISHFLRLVNSNFTQFFRHFLCKITSIHHKNLKFQKINSKIHVLSHKINCFYHKK